MGKVMKYITDFFFIITTSTLLWAGTREMVENRVDALDRLNRSKK